MIAFSALGGLCPAQVPTRLQQPQPFDVAVVKPNHSGSGSTTGRTFHGQLTATNVTVRDLVLRAFQLMNTQVTGGPDWINSERYEVTARTEDTSISDDRLWLSLQPLLSERFHLKLHRTTKDAPIYSLIVGQAKHTPVPHKGQDEPSLSTSISSSIGKMQGSNISMAGLAAALTPIAGRTVIDNTPLAGGFDFKLEWEREAPDGSMLGAIEQKVGLSSPTLTDAVQDQLGLKLQPRAAQWRCW